ncbi:UNVERIFIED_CONTAM: F-box/FBD/LRR-repeat protein [Sesamum angustifolium]|uniref:F-box/FBD/LRR-repeat protein n=1 Tax=Sesamum angustifolium TaxID=2727405 RepID=A0AAW2LUX7_9LAMI
MARTRIRRGLDADRISNLPSNVIDNILTLLPLHDAVRTSVLSKGWQYKWVTVPYLVFDWTFNLSGNYSIESIIYQVLLLHRGPIVKFKFCGFKFGPDINNWLYFLSDHRVEELVLMNSVYYPEQWLISHNLFTFDHLMHLFLANVEVRLPSTFKGFRRLLSLDLNGVEFEPEELNMFISKCPMLEYINLNLLTIFYLRHLEVDAPNLKEISITCYPIFRRTTSEAGDDDSNMIKVLGQLSSLTKLYCDGGFLQFLAKGGVPQKLPVNLNSMRYLLLDITDFGFKDQVCSVLCLIRSSPNLQSLQITSANGSAADMMSTTQFLRAEQENEIPLCRLDNVTMRGFTCRIPEIEFLKLLLLAATVLRRLEIHFAIYLSEVERRKFSQELLSLQRASSEVEIVFQHLEDPTTSVAQ